MNTPALPVPVDTRGIHPLKTWQKGLLRMALILGVSGLCALAHAGPYDRGPDPTAASLEASTGSYTVATSKIVMPSGYGGGTVYYPSATSDGPFGVVSFSPGFVNSQNINKWWASALASRGFVVVMIDTLTPFDLPGMRGNEMLASLKDVITRSQNSSTPYYGKIDPNRRAVMGHSMGGGGSLSASVSDPTLKAAIPLAPWSANNNLSKDTVPTLVIAGEVDAIAPPSTMATVFYASLPATTDKAYMELKGADHFFPNNNGPAAMKPIMTKYAVSWLKLFVDGDTRYSKFLCGALHDADVAASVSLLSAYKENCPY
jgi:dienelactone hydrolase